MTTVEGQARQGSKPPRRRPTVVAGVVGLVVLTVAVGIGLLSLASRPRASSPSLGGRIVVVDASEQLRTIDATGGAERRYALASSPLQFPAWSPDGEHLAAVGVQDKGTGLFVLDDRASAPSPQVTPDSIYRSDAEPPFYLFWSPDGRQVTFLTSEPDGLALRSAPADGSTPGGIVRRGAPIYWAWTADDRLLVHAGGDGPDGYVGEVRLDGLETRRSAIVPGRFQAPAVSSDGRRRAYVISTDEPEPEIRSMVVLVEDDRDGSVRRVAVAGPTALGWGSGPGSLAFIAPRERQPLPLGPLDVLDADSTQPRILLDQDVVAFFWSPDGTSIAALTVASGGPRQVASRHVASPQVASLRALPAPVDAPSAATPGASLQLVILDAADGRVHLDRPVRVSETFAGQLLPYFDQYALSHHLWSPDSSALVLPLVGDDDRSRITVVPRDGSEPRAIADGEIAFWAP